MEYYNSVHIRKSLHYGAAEHLKQRLTAVVESYCSRSRVGEPLPLHVVEDVRQRLASVLSLVTKGVVCGECPPLN